jgi:hypothetical protein
MRGITWLLGFGIAAGLCLAAPGIARAQDRLPLRFLSAPSDPAQLLAFAMQPPETDTDTPTDTDTTVIKKEEPKGQGSNNPAPVIDNQPKPTFDKPDTSKTGGFNQAPLETLGAPGTTNRNFGGAASSLPVAQHARRGLLGIHPLAILVALIAVHVFVVTRVVK